MTPLIRFTLYTRPTPILAPLVLKTLRTGTLGLTSGECTLFTYIVYTLVPI